MDFEIETIKKHSRFEKYIYKNLSWLVGSAAESTLHFEWYFVSYIALYPNFGDF